MRHYHLSKTLSKEQRLMLNIIGFLELAPLVLGILLTEKCAPLLFRLDYLLAGFLVSMLVMFYLGKYAPQLPIHQTKPSKCASA